MGIRIGKATGVFFRTPPVVAILVRHLRKKKKAKPTPLPAPCTTNILFEDNFNDGNYGGRTVKEGSFSVSKGYLEQLSEPGAIYRSVDIDFNKNLSIEFGIAPKDFSLQPR